MKVREYLDTNYKAGYVNDGTYVIFKEGTHIVVECSYDLLNKNGKYSDYSICGIKRDEMHNVLVLELHNKIYIKYNGMYFKEGVIGCYFIKDKENATQCIDIQDAEKYIIDDMNEKLTNVVLLINDEVRRYNAHEDYWYSTKLDFECEHCHVTYPKCDGYDIVNIDGEQRWCGKCYEDNQFDVELIEE